MSKFTTGGKSEKIDLTEKVIDEILTKMHDSLAKCDEFQGKMVKLRNAEVDLLTSFESARNFMNAALQSPDEGRELLARLFGGDCRRMGRIRAFTNACHLSDMYKSDARHPDCVSAMESVEAVLADMGLGWALRQAAEKEAEGLKRGRSAKWDDPPMEAETGTTETPEMGEAAEFEEPEAEEPQEPVPWGFTPVEPPAPEPAKPAPAPKQDLASEKLAKTMDEDIIEQILACNEPWELAEIPEPDKKENLGNWMIWMVHRAHLDDPTLAKFDFTNLQMPAGHIEPRISPKLAEAMSWNSHITSLLLPNTNLGAKEGGVLAESISKNGALKVLNVDSNFLGQPEMESLANAVGTSKTIEEVRVNNMHGFMMGKTTIEAWANAVKANPMVCKLGLTISDPHYRNEIDRSIMRNGDEARKRRVAAKKAAEAGYAA